MATISEVARLAQVSSATVSHVINKTRKVNPETIEKVENAIRELDYRPNLHARGLKTGYSHMIGVLNDCSRDQFFSEILNSLERSAYAAGYGVMVHNSENNAAAQREAINSLLDKKIDGLIINSPIINDDFYILIERISCPSVFLQFYDPSIQADVIHSDDLKAAYDATRFLIGLNHRRIACIAGCAYQQNSAFQRRSGYEKALRETGLPVDETLFVYSNYSTQEGYDLFKKLYSQNHPPTAFLTYSDLLALGALRAAADMGLSIPADVSLIGFDDIEIASFCVPRLTTVYQDKTQMGELAFQLIQKRMQNPCMPHQRIVLPTRLIVRESCAAAPLSPRRIPGLFH